MAGKYEGYGRPDGDICYTSADPFATFLMTAQPAATPLTRLCPPEPFTSHWEVMERSPKSSAARPIRPSGDGVLLGRQNFSSEGVSVS
jgi:hypothetical protein